MYRAARVLRQRVLAAGQHCLSARVHSGNYRLLYARTLAAGINHFNQAQIILNLLAAGRHTRPEHRQEENALINAALRGLPPQRAWKLWEQARKRGINNRRTRALARDYLAQRRSQSFEAVKYRAKYARLPFTRI